jgi:hypothetical protein
MPAFGESEKRMKNTIPPLSPAENFHYYKARVPKLDCGVYLEG